jgi:hypothetical protein
MKEKKKKIIKKKKKDYLYISLSKIFIHTLVMISIYNLDKKLDYIIYDDIKK